MEARAILRLIYKKTKPVGQTKVSRRGLFGEEAWRVDDYIVTLDSLIIQYPEGPDAYRYDSSILRISPLPWKTYCRWHNGPLWVKDDPWTRLYCVVESDSYCKQHKRSLRALYEFCLGTNNPQALGICKRIDELGRTEYAVYLTDAGAGRVKVGVTRKFRIIERLSEQAHNIATILHVTDSIYEARKIEITIGRKGYASQMKARKPQKLPLAQVISKVYVAAERIAKELSISWDHRFIRVISPYMETVLSGKHVKPSSLENQKVEIAGYWGGFLIVKSSRGIVALKDRDLLHKSSIIISK